MNESELLEKVTIIDEKKAYYSVEDFIKLISEWKIMS
jgi:hypothetical protein